MKKNQNRFGALSAALKGEVLPEQPEIPSEAEAESPVTDTQPRKKGRAKGKRSNPDYEQVGVYLPKSLTLKAKRILLEREDMDFSDLVAQLLSQWIDESDNQ
jgi:hypothetical protein